MIQRMYLNIFSTQKILHYRIAEIPDKNLSKLAPAALISTANTISQADLLYSQLSKLSPKTSYFCSNMDKTCSGMDIELNKCWTTSRELIGIFFAN